MDKDDLTTDITQNKDESRVIILAPQGAEVYVDDIRRGNIGSSARLVLKSIPPGRHQLRISLTGEREDERVIEVLPDACEQIIEAQIYSVRKYNDHEPMSGLAMDKEIVRKAPKFVLSLHYGFKIIPCLIGAFSIYLGYRLFILGVTGQASLSVNSNSISGQLLNAAPGLFFAIGGIIIVIVAIRKSITFQNY